MNKLFNRYKYLQVFYIFYLFKFININVNHEQALWATHAHQPAVPLPCLFMQRLLSQFTIFCVFLCFHLILRAFICSSVLTAQSVNPIANEPGLGFEATSSSGCSNAEKTSGAHCATCTRRVRSRAHHRKRVCFK